MVGQAVVEELVPETVLTVAEPEEVEEAAADDEAADEDLELLLATEEVAAALELVLVDLTVLEVVVAADEDELLPH